MPNEVSINAAPGVGCSFKPASRSDAGTAAADMCYAAACRHNRAACSVPLRHHQRPSPLALTWRPDCGATAPGTRLLPVMRKLQHPQVDDVGRSSRPFCLRHQKLGPAITQGRRPLQSCQLYTPAQLIASDGKTWQA